MTDEEARALQSELLERWAGDAPPLRVPYGHAVVQALRTRQPPKPGLAIGRSVERRSGQARLEIRVTATRGRRAAEAAELLAEARKRGDVNVRTISPPRARGARRARATSATGAGVAELICKRVPLHLGCSIAHEEGSAGSIGAFVRLPEGGTGVLSCCHVLAMNGRASAGDHIVQPGWPDEPRARPVNRIGKLTPAFSPFIKNQDNNLDAAVAKLADDVQHMGTVVPDHPSITNKALRGQKLTNVLPAEELREGDRVAKFGRTTGYREGSVSAIDFQSLDVLVGSSRPRLFKFSQVIEISWDTAQDRGWIPFSEAGDSGSLVFRVDDSRPVGLHFAMMDDEGTEPTSYAIHLDRILLEYNLGLV